MRTLALTGANEMTNLVQISDLHFGRTDAATIEPLIKKINEIRPRVITVCGDLTQRARTSEFQQAKSFLAKLPSPQVIVPGNHDIPLHNFAARFFQPLTKYRRYIAQELHPFYRDGSVAILGLNTARSLTTKYGRINRLQMAEIRRRFAGLQSGMTKIVVTHHPFDLPQDANARDLVGRAEQAMASLSECSVDLLLSGHMHATLVGRTTHRYKIAGYSAIFVHAGTAVSMRGRGEPNSFNLLKIAFPRITIEQLSWDAVENRFVPRSSESFFRTTKGWTKEQPTAEA